MCCASLWRNYRAASSVVREAILPAAATRIARGQSSRVVKPGRTFLPRMIDLLRTSGVTKPRHHIRLNREFRVDLQWWKKSLCIVSLRDIADFGSYFGRLGGLGQRGLLRIELVPAGMATRGGEPPHLLQGAVCWSRGWGSRWHGTRVRWLCDNKAAVYAVSKRSCRNAADACGLGISWQPTIRGGRTCWLTICPVIVSLYVHVACACSTMNIHKLCYSSLM